MHLLRLILCSFQDTFESRKRSFIGAFSICVAVALRKEFIDKERQSSPSKALQIESTKPPGSDDSNQKGNVDRILVMLKIATL